MNREIKFRAWNGDAGMMDNLDCVNLEMVRKSVISNDGDETFGDCEYMQYTGLKDINDKEIYEGDIVSAHNFYFDGNFGAEHEFNGVVMFSEWATFGLSKINARPDGCSWFEFADTSHFENPCLEVIGNIHENQNLLTEHQ